MKKTRLFFAVVLVVTLSACGGGESSSTNPQAATPTPTVITTGTLRLWNNATVQIDHGYLSPAGSTTWGLDQMSEPLPAATYGDLTNISAGTYDAKVTAISPLSIYFGYLYNFSIVAEQTYSLYASNSSFTGSIKLINNFLPASNITEFYISPTTNSTWGSNRLSSPILPSEVFHLYNIFTVPTDTYDIGIRFASDPVLPAGPVWVILGETVESLSLVILDDTGSAIVNEY